MNESTSRLAYSKAPRCASSMRSIRRGFTLVDAVAMMMVIGTLTSLSAVALNLAYAAHARSLEQFRHVQNLQNAFVRMRNDAHRAQDVSADRVLQLAFSDQRVVEYSVREDRLLRATSIAGVTQGVEDWQLPGSCTSHWSVQRDGALPLLVARFEFDASQFSIGPVECVTRVGCEVHD